MRRLLPGLALLLLWAGCASDPGRARWDQAWLRAERLLSQGYLARARGGFEALAKSAIDESDRVEMQLRVAECWRRGRRFGASLARLDVAATQAREMDLELRAKIQYHRARVMIDAGHDERGQALLQTLMDRWPNAAFGERAYIYLRGAWRARGAPAFLAWLNAGWRRHRDDHLTDNFLFRAGDLYFQRHTRAGDIQAASLLRRVVTRWRFETSGLWDDAIWELSLIEHRQGHFRAEIDLLERLLSTRELTWLGSGQIENYRWAHVRIGRIYYFDYKEYARAAQHFAAFQKIWAHSRFVDDLLWWEAWAWRMAGDESKARARFERLLSQFPQSKWSRRVREGRPGPRPQDPPP